MPDADPPPSLTLHTEDDFPAARGAAWDRGNALQDKAAEAFQTGFLLAASAKALGFEELMMGQAFRVGRIIATLANVGPSEADALHLARALAEGAGRYAADYVREDRAKQAKAAALAQDRAEGEAPRARVDGEG